MKKAKHIYSLSRWTIKLIALFALTGAALATPEPLDLSFDLDLDNYRGQTFLATMIMEKEGIVAEMDYAHYREYSFPSWAEVKHAVNNFDTKNKRRTLSAFDNDLKKLKKFTDSLSGTPFTMADNEDKKKAKHLPNIVDVIRKKYRGKGNVYSLGHFFGLAASGGTLVIIDKDNYFYNIGYYHPEVRSGRSYAASPLHPANDVSHKNYLKDLEKYLKGDQEKLFYSILMNILTNTDDSNYSKLSDLGESVATDFVAVYVAELRRHIMRKLHPNRNEWGNDYIEITFLSAYCSSASKKGKPMLMMKVIDADGNQRIRLQTSNLYRWWEMNYETKRSGIGKTQRERRKLQRYVSDYMREYHPKLVRDVQAITGRRKDVYKGLSEYLNNYDTPLELGKDAQRLSKAMVAFLLKTQEDADKITAYIYDDNKWLAPQEGDQDWVQWTKKQRSN